MSRSFSFEVGEYYHCYSRGTEKRNIFLNKKDYERFIALLFACNSITTIHLSDYQKKTFGEIFDIVRGDSLVDIGAYCLMSNHFHLLLHEKEEGGISIFMQKLITAYTMYFNKKYERTGALFAGRFKAEHANKDKYLKYLFAYIHLNPVKIIDPKWKETRIKNIHRTRDFLKSYIYSSYLDYIGSDRPQKNILAKESFPLYFKNQKEFETEISEWLTYYDSTDVKVQP